jgi:hypothetical protein
MEAVVPVIWQIRGVYRTVGIIGVHSAQVCGVDQGIARQGGS